MACAEKNNYLKKVEKKEKRFKLKRFKINELIMLSGNILSWTVCVESSCFLTPVGDSLPLPVLLCFCSPSVSVVVSWHLYSSEGWGRAERRGGGAFTSWPMWWHSNSAAVLNVGKTDWAVYAWDTMWEVSVSGMNHKSLQHMSTLVMWRPTEYAAGPGEHFWSEP